MKIMIFSITMLALITCKPAKPLNSEADDGIDSLRGLAKDQSTPANLARTLCQANDELIVYSCLLSNGKTASICISRDFNSSTGYILYRFGTPQRIEFEYPKDKTNTLQAFSYQWYLRGGGAGNAGMDNNHLTFSNGGFTYELFHDYSAGSDDPALQYSPSSSAGIKVTDSAQKQISEVECLPDQSVGSLIYLRGTPIPQP